MSDSRVLIDIDAELQAMDQDPTVLIELPNGAFLELLIDVPRQTRLKNKHLRPGGMKLDAETFDRFQALRSQLGDNPSQEQLSEAIKGHESEFQLEIDNGEQDFYGFGVALADFMTGWRGFSGTFSKKRAKEWIQRKPGIAEAIGRQYDRILAEYEKKHSIQIEEEAKN